MSMPMEFTLTEAHLKLLSKMFVGWQDCETGAPEIDPKRPYGNSDVAGDVAEIVGVVDYDSEDDDQYQAMHDLHSETGIALQIVLSTRSFEPGRYKRLETYDTQHWVRA